MSVAPILTRALRYGAILAAVVTVLGAGIGFLVAGMPGFAAGIVGGVMVGVLTALTAGSILLAARVSGDLGSPVFFGIVLGSWLLKLILFLVLNIWLRGQPWVDPYVFFATVIVAVMGSLAVDVLAFQRARVPYVSDPKPSTGTGD